MTRIIARPGSRVRRFLRDRSAMSTLEFAFALPILMVLAGDGIELTNYFLYNSRVSQYALDLADNMSRVDNGPKLRELDINNAFTGTYLEGKGIGLTTNGRATLTSLENLPDENGTYVQRVHWQRCIGLKSDVGFEATLSPKPESPDGGIPGSAGTAGVAAPTGYGDQTSTLNAPKDGGAIIVEINYSYQPVFGTIFFGPKTIHYVSSFIVRDDRDFRYVYNSEGQTPSTCDLHSDIPPPLKH